MPLSSHILFASVYLVAVASPGPSIAALVARVLSRGTAGIVGFAAGFVVGDLVWFSVAALGFALVVRSFAIVFVGLKYAGAAYLAYLAWKNWTARTDTVEAASQSGGDSALRLFLGGLTLTLGNPKVILFFLVLLPSLVVLDNLTPLGIAEIGATIMVVLSAVLTAYVLAAARARRIFTSSRARRVINRGAGTVMAGAAVAIATR